MRRPVRAKTAPETPAEAPASPSSSSPQQRIEELEAELAAVRGASERALADLRAQFDRAWADRETELAKLLPPTAPVRGRIVVATCLLHAHTRSGEKVSIRANDPIPDTVDLATLDAGTYAEKVA